MPVQSRTICARRIASWRNPYTDRDHPIGVVIIVTLGPTLGLAQQNERLHKPGETAPVSGLYRVTHNSHRRPHSVVVLVGETFPACRSCRRLVAFELIEPIDHVAHDWDFTGPNLQLIHSRDRDNEANKK